jgi:hypothetical protein
MLDFIQRHAKLSITIATIIVIGLFIVLFLLSDSGPKSVNNNSGADEVSKELNYSFLLDDTPKQDQYLKLLGIRMAEDYGTYSNNDIRPLQDLQNQSTADFKTDVQIIMDTIPLDTDVVTLIDAESVTLNLQGNQANLLMDGVRTEKDGKSFKITNTIELIKVAEYWLVKKIKLEYK